jgi:hypothetical protein
MIAGCSPGRIRACEFAKRDGAIPFPAGLGFREPAVGRYRSIGGLGEEAVRHEAEEDWG